MSMLSSLKTQAKQLKQHPRLYFAARDPHAPSCRASVFVAAYALSPIDLIPDFIPVVATLMICADSAWFGLGCRLTPPEVLESARARAKQAASKPISYTAAAFFVALWLVVAWVAVSWVVSVVRT